MKPTERVKIGKLPPPFHIHFTLFGENRYKQRKRKDRIYNYVECDERVCRNMEDVSGIEAGSQQMCTRDCV